MERMRLQQLAAAQAFAAQTPEDSTVVTPQALEWTRALVEQGPITVVPSHASSSVTPPGTGIQEFDNEQVIAERDAAAMQPFVVAARDRLRLLKNPPLNQQQCDELREQLELQHDDPDAYDITDANGEKTPVQFQTFRAYSEALRSVEAMHLPTVLETLHREHGISEDDLHLAFREHYNFRNLNGLAGMYPGLRAEGFSRHHIMSIAANVMGYQNLRAVVRHASALIEQRFTRGEIMRIAAHRTGRQSVEAVIEYAPHLIPMGFTTRQVARMAAYPNGHMALYSAFNLTPALLERGVTLAEIARAGVSEEGHGSSGLHDLYGSAVSRRQAQ
jgi:hypothetical protein